MSAAVSETPFQLPAAILGRLPIAMRANARRLLEHILHFPGLNRAYACTRTMPAEQSFCERAIQSLGVTARVSAEDLRRVPAKGPLIIVANHPFGGLDGLILGAMLQRVRPDVKLLANYLLGCIPEMRDICFLVDPFGGPDAVARNRGAVRAAIRWVRAGGALGVFPAGEVAYFTLEQGSVTDPPWNESIARLVEQTGAAVLPVYFDGHNSRLFQLAGLLHSRLRTIMLPRELLGSRGKSVRVEIGSVIPPRRIARFFESDNSQDAAKRVTDYLRVRTYILKGRCTPASHKEAPRSRIRPPAQPIVAARSSAQVAADVAALPACQHLVESGSLQVLYGSAEQLPNVLHEIGRLRETAFRLVGEGTGREIDLDRFDEHYLHLFAWNAHARHIVGAYRVGQTDELLKRFGPAGLYTSTLFDFSPRLLDQIGPALELGRSFVVPEYQRDYAPLLLLWKGIGRFVVTHPRYRRLFGAVSISDEFASMTRQLLMAFLRMHSFDHELASLVRPRNPPKLPRFRDADAARLATLVNDVADVEELVGEIESNGRTVPVLLRQYLKLNARLLGFNVDPDFGHVLDGLVLADLVTVDRAILTRYLGRDGAAAFLSHHRVSAAGQPGITRESGGRWSDR